MFKRKQKSRSAGKQAVLRRFASVIPFEVAIDDDEQTVFEPHPVTKEQIKGMEEQLAKEIGELLAPALSGPLKEGRVLLGVCAATVHNIRTGKRLPGLAILNKMAAHVGKRVKVTFV